MKKSSELTALLLLLCTISMVIVSGCQKDKEEKAPELPPLSSMVMDFGDFDGTTKSIEAQNPFNHGNRNLALLHVGVWNTVVFVHMAIPVAAFKASFNHKPTFIGNNSWQWAYTTEVGIHSFSALLVAQIDGAQVEWTMSISKSGPGAFDDFVWFTGTSDIKGKEGTWTLYHSPQNPTPFISIEWYNKSDNNKGITYTNIISGDKENGGYISYGLTDKSPFNAFYKIFQKSKNNLVEINWNTTTKAGQIKDPGHFGNDAFYCWNELGVNSTCP